MPHWKCSRCRKRQPSNSTKYKACLPSIWDTYITVVGSEPSDDDVLCSKCLCYIRNSVGLISGRSISQDDVDWTEPSGKQIEFNIHHNVLTTTGLSETALLSNLTTSDEPFQIQLPALKMPSVAGQKNCGLTNVGNTCYVNAALQAIFHVPVVLNWLAGVTHSHSIESELHDCIVCAVTKTMEDMNHCTGSLVPFEIISRLPSILQHFVLGRQEDAHEFLSLMLQRLHDSWLKYCVVQPNSNQDRPLEDLFRGEQRNQVTCSRCLNTSTTFHPIGEIQLEIAQNASIDSAIEQYFLAENINDYFCTICGDAGLAVKHLFLNVAPVALCLQLKRFTDSGLKLDNQIKVNPLLRISRFMHASGSQQDGSYRLVSIINHLGSSANSGHYTAATLQENGAMLLFDDSNISGVSLRTGTENVYVLLYEVNSVNFVSDLDTQYADAKLDDINTESVVEMFEIQTESSASRIVSWSHESLEHMNSSNECGYSQQSTASSQPFSEVSLDHSYASHHSSLKMFHAGYKIILPNTQACKASQSRCFICHSKTNVRRLVPKHERDRVWFLVRVKIHKNNRCCHSHLVSGKFNEVDLKAISSNATGRVRITIEETEEWIHDLTLMASVKKIRIDFCSPDVNDRDYQMLTGLAKADFEDLLSYLDDTLNVSNNRSVRNALGIFLVKMRMNLSHNFLQFLFGVDDISVISRTIRSVTNALKTKFLPRYLGYGHITREELRTSKSIGSFNPLLSVGEDKLTLILDGTYLYIQKPSSHSFQKKTFSVQKGRNLLKPMMVVTTTGYIWAVSGLHGADGKNNDACILKQMMKKSDSIRAYLHKGDVLVLDRGFRDAITVVQGYGFQTRMPHLLKKNEKQFDTQRGNESRMVTKVRWMVEAVNGRVKNMWKFMAAVIANSHIPCLKSYFDIACALTNAYYPPILSDSQELESEITKVIARKEVVNHLQERIESEGLNRKRSHWIEADSTTVTTFPRLSTEEVRSVTLGPYQIKMAENYTHQHLSTSSRYKIMVHREDTNLIRCKIQSRFTSAKAHNLFIQFTENGSGREAIEGSVCQCKTGNRTVGTCAHIASVIWYLGYARHNPQCMRKKRHFAYDILDAAEDLEDDSAEVLEDDSAEVLEDDSEEHLKYDSAEYLEDDSADDGHEDESVEC